MTDIHVMAPGKPYMAKLVDAGDGSFSLRIVPLPEVEELDRLRKEVAHLRVRSGANAHAAMSIALRYGMKLPPQAARVLAFLFVNSERQVSKAELLDVMYGHRADGGPDWSSRAVDVVMSRVRKALGGRKFLPSETGLYWLTPEGVRKCRDVVERDETGE